MSYTARRVRLTRIIHEPIGRDPHPRPIGIIEYPRVSSFCGNRPPVWEWRIARAILL